MRWELVVGIMLILVAFSLMYYLPRNPITTMLWIAIGIVGGRLISKVIY
jgi:hypothetical protein